MSGRGVVAKRQRVWHCCTLGLHIVLSNSKPCMSWKLGFPTLAFQSSDVRGQMSVGGIDHTSSLVGKLERFVVSLTK